MPKQILAPLTSEPALPWYCRVTAGFALCAIGKILLLCGTARGATLQDISDAIYYSRFIVGVVLGIISLSHYGIRGDIRTLACAVYLLAKLVLQPTTSVSEFPVSLVLLVFFMGAVSLSSTRDAEESRKAVRATRIWGVLCILTSLVVMLPLVAMTTAFYENGVASESYPTPIFDMSALYSSAFRHIAMVALLSVLIATLLAYYRQIRAFYIEVLAWSLLPHAIGLVVNELVVLSCGHQIAVVSDALSTSVYIVGASLDAAVHTRQLVDAAASAAAASEELQHRLRLQLSDGEQRLHEALSRTILFREERRTFLTRLAERLKPPIAEILAAATALDTPTPAVAQEISGNAAANHSAVATAWHQHIETIKDAARSLSTLATDLARLTVLSDSCETQPAVSTAAATATAPPPSDVDTPFKVADLIEEVLEASTVHLVAASRDTELTYELDDDVPEVLCGDVASFRQILLQLVSNAIKFTRAGEIAVVVSIGTKADESDEEDNGNADNDVDDTFVESDTSEIDQSRALRRASVDTPPRRRAYLRSSSVDRIDTAASSNTVVLKVDVVDTGIGIPPEQLRHLFEPFPPGRAEPAGTDAVSTTAAGRRRRGSGLGLLICSKLVTLLGGRIRVASTPATPGHHIPDHGTTVTVTARFRVPSLDQVHAAIPDVDAASRVTELLRGRRVLVIDPMERNCRLVATALTAHGAIVHMSTDSIKALREVHLASATGGRYDLVLLAGAAGAGRLRPDELAATVSDDPHQHGVAVVLMVSPGDASALTDAALAERGFRGRIVKPLRRAAVAAAAAAAIAATQASPPPTPTRNSKGHNHATAAAKKTNESGERPLPTVTRRVLFVGSCAAGVGTIGRELRPAALALGYDWSAVEDEAAALAAAELLAATPAGDAAAFDAVIVDVDSDPARLDVTNVLQILRARDRAFSESAARRGSANTAADMRRTHIPIIGVTTRPSAQDREFYKEIGIDEYVPLAVAKATLGTLLAAAQMPKRRSIDRPVHGKPAMARRRRSSADESAGNATATPAANTTDADAGVDTTGTELAVSSEGFATSSNVAAMATEIAMLRARVSTLERALRCYVPRDFSELIAPGGAAEAAELGDAVLKWITIFFSDIRDFTTLAEQLSVHQVMEFVNTYLAFALPAIADAGGFVDKFIGDAIMAIFAAPDVSLQALSAVRAAVRMMRALEFMVESGFRRVETGIGINTGRTIVGIVGTETRMQPTAMGDAVNLASRTESLCKIYGARILITEHTKTKMGAKGEDEFVIRLVDYVCVKGKSEPCRIYEVLDGHKVEVRRSKEAILSLYSEAISLYWDKKDYAAARELFNKCLDICPDDVPSYEYLKRCTRKLEASTKAVEDRSSAEATVDGAVLLKSK